MFLSYITELDWAWLAGFIDGEGTIGLNKRGRDLREFRPTIKIFNTNKEVLDYIQSLLSTGSVCPMDKKSVESKTCKTVYMWTANIKESIIPILEHILPYLKVKNKQAELLLIYCKEHIKGSTSTAIEIEIYEDMKELNMRGIRR